MSEIARNRSLSDEALCHQRTMMHQVNNDLALLASAVRLSSQGLSEFSDRELIRKLEQRIHLLTILYKNNVRSNDGVQILLDVLLVEVFDLLIGTRKQGCHLNISPGRVSCSYPIARAFLFLVSEILLDYFDSSYDAEPLCCTLTYSHGRWFCEVRQEGHVHPLSEDHSLMIQAFTMQLGATVSDVSNLHCRSIVIEFKEAY